jgi:hypothetical protein
MTPEERLASSALKGASCCTVNCHPRQKVLEMLRAQRQEDVAQVLKILNETVGDEIDHGLAMNQIKKALGA